MTSAESIGSCSLDVDATGSESSGTLDAPDADVSERSAKSTNATLEKEEQDKIQNGHNKDNDLSSDIGEDLSPVPFKLPSYLGISCAISGYTNYSRFCRSRDNSPARLGLVEFGPLEIRHDNPETMAIANGNVSTATPKSNATTSSISPRMDYFKSFTTEEVSTSAEINGKVSSSVLCETNAISEVKLVNGAEKNVANGKLNLVASVQPNGDAKESTGKRKSLVQQRIESLYGQNVAAGWRASRCRTRTREVSNVDACNGVGEKRSPSCPPQTRGRSKSPPVFKHLTKDFKEQLREVKNGESESSPTNTIVRNTAACQERHEHKLPDDLKVRCEIPSKEEGNFQQIIVTNTVKEDSDKPEAVQRLKPVLPPKPPSLSTPSSPVNNGTVSAANNLKSTPQEAKDGRWYIACLDEETANIRLRIAAAEDQLKSEDVPDDACGVIRVAIGKANLLVSKKFKQFRELCMRNINPNDGDELIPKVSDLEGFWDMVLLQVADVNDSFDKIDALQANQWKEVSPEKKASTLGKKAKSSLKPGVSRSTPTTPLRSAKASETAMAREEARRMLREAKRKGRQQALQKETDSEVAIFLPDEKK